MRIAIVGQNPSSYNDNPDVPFKGAACEARLNSWIGAIMKEFPDAQIHLMNISNRLDYPFVPNMEEVSAMPERTKDFDYLLCLGGATYKTCLSCKNWFKAQVPHPSPRNRLWNDTEYKENYIKHLINELKEARHWRENDSDRRHSRLF